MTIYLSNEQAALPFEKVLEIIKSIKKAAGYPECDQDYKQAEDE